MKSVQYPTFGTHFFATLLLNFLSLNGNNPFLFCPDYFNIHVGTFGVGPNTKTDGYYYCHEEMIFEQSGWYLWITSTSFIEE